MARRCRAKRYRSRSAGGRDIPVHPATGLSGRSTGITPCEVSLFDACLHLCVSLTQTDDDIGKDPSLPKEFHGPVENLPQAVVIKTRDISANSSGSLPRY